VYIQGDSEIGGNILGTCSTNDNKAKFHTYMIPITLSISVEIDSRMLGNSKWSI
jgi:hypothetical protein